MTHHLKVVKVKFGHLADIEDPMEDGIDVPEESQAQKIPISMKNLTYVILLISFMPLRKC